MKPDADASGGKHVDVESLMHQQGPDYHRSHCCWGSSASVPTPELHGDKACLDFLPGDFFLSCDSNSNLNGKY